MSTGFRLGLRSALIGSVLGGRLALAKQPGLTVERAWGQEEPQLAVALVLLPHQIHTNLSICSSKALNPIPQAADSTAQSLAPQTLGKPETPA